ncbi:precorrin-6A reductase [Dorea sp. D27]|uniref:precorrin-6A reductase n=1 Tax=Dorea sp. D27 TaxID=658665 RepID=UPI000673A799|nr:precorrin-6A reductase [Dorea sp. D27]KMZ55466.1 precorrin-6x reductase [Dorea sp. D27]
MSGKILLFAGTTEGRELAEFLRGQGISAYVSTATEYGRECVGEGGSITVCAGRMDEGDIRTFIETHAIALAVDATHPFATVATENIRRACEACGTGYIRCLRERQQIEAADGMVWVDSVEDAVDYLKRKDGNIFISTGSKELRHYTEIPGYEDRCYARVLSTKEAVEESIGLGFRGRHLIAMQGPFSRELNVGMLQYAQAGYFVTKESGKAGGFEEKADAAKETGAVLVVIGRPPESGLNLEETKAYLIAYSAKLC